MANATDTEFEALAAQLTDPSTPLPKAGDVKAGTEAAASGYALMLQEYGSREALDEVLGHAGRPRLGEPAKGSV